MTGMELLLALDSGEVSRLTPAGSGDWTPGMKVTLFSDGTLEEKKDAFDDLCALYLRVLDDLWAVDEGLNSDITMLSMDLSQTGLSDSEQAAVAWAFGGEHGISQVLSLNYEQLAAEGYLTGADPDSDGIPCWEDGCLFTITEQETGDNELNGARNTVTFDAQKWRSALGAYFFTDCTASRDAQGHWGDYTVGAAAIS